MVREIISGVCGKLEAEFPGVKVYTVNKLRKEGVLSSKNPLREPNFFVSCKSPKSTRSKDRYFTSTQLLGNRYLRSIALCVECRWFVDEEGSPVPDWQEVLNRLFVCLEYVDAGDGAVVRGDSMQGEYVDDVLNFYVTYNLFVYLEDKEKTSELMGKYVLNF